MADSKPLADASAAPPLALHRLHPRAWAANRFVYPVLSRRSGGLSLGVNLNPDKVCNFDCIYCQVDRTSEAETRFVAIDQLEHELASTLATITSGAIYDHEPFSSTPPELRRLNDIALSGDGEPTTYRNFDDIVARIAEVKRRSGLEAVKIVLITNASMLHRPRVRHGLELLDANNGEIWAKLEAGTEAYYQLIERTRIPFRRVLDNIASAAQVRPLVIQALFMRVHGEAPPEAEQLAFCDRLNEITATGGRLKLIQLYTVARQPAESFVSPLADAELSALADRVRERTQLPVAVFPGAPAL